MRKLIYLIIIILTACDDPTVVFMDPQPEGKNDLKSFPARYRGTYIKNDGGSVYIITAGMILQKHEDSFAETFEDLIEEEDFELKGDTLTMKDINIKIPVTRRNDSIFGHIVLYDTIFDINKNNKLRKLGRTYFLNFPSSSYWWVFKLTFDRSGKAYVCDINHEIEMGIIEQYCEIEKDTIKDGTLKKYILVPDRKELKRILKQETFTDTTEYFRISQEAPR